MNGTPNTLQTVLDCITELTMTTGLAPRQRIIELSGLSPSIVKDRVDELIDSGKVCRVERGVYKNIVAFPPARAISRTVMPDGLAIIEVGDTVLKLTPQEESRLGSMYSGGAQPPPVAHQALPSALHILDAEDVATMLGCSQRAVEDKARSGELPGVRFGAASAWVFPAEALGRAMNRLAEEEAMRRAQPAKPLGAQRRARPQLPSV